MDLIFDKVVELQHVLDTHHSTLFEWFTCLTVIELDFPICRDTCLLHKSTDLVYCHTSEYGSRHSDTEFLRSTSEVGLEDLSDVYT